MFFFLGLLTTYLKVEQLILFSRAAGFYSLRSSKFVGWSKVVADSAEAPPPSRPHAPTPFPRSFSSSLSWGEFSSKRHNWTLTPLPSVSCKNFSLQTQGDGGGVGDTSTIQPCSRFSLFLTLHQHMIDSSSIAIMRRLNKYYFIQMNKNMIPCKTHAALFTAWNRTST